MLVPAATTIGTFAAVILQVFAAPPIAYRLPLRRIDSAYYSLSSILISEYRGARLGTVALLANIIREFFVLVSLLDGEVFR